MGVLGTWDAPCLGGFWGCLGVPATLANSTPQVKKLVYVYLVRYAEEQQDLALLSISTFQRGLKVGTLDALGGKRGGCEAVPARCNNAYVPAGPQPADPRQRAACPLQHPRTHHRTHHDAGHQGGRIRHVPICA